MISMKYVTGKPQEIGLQRYQYINISSVNTQTCHEKYCELDSLPGKNSAIHFLIHRVFTTWYGYQCPPHWGKLPEFKAFHADIHSMSCTDSIVVPAFWILIPSAPAVCKDSCLFSAVLAALVKVDLQAPLNSKFTGSKSYIETISVEMIALLQPLSVLLINQQENNANLDQWN